jgi:Protein of unknown function (DUF1360)
LVDPFAFILLALASFRVTRFFVEDILFEPVRDKIWEKFPPSTKLGYLFTCYWCLGFWVSALILVLYLLFPSVMIVPVLLLALSAVVGMIAKLLDR